MLQDLRYSVRTRQRLIRQLLSESVLLGTLGALAGLLGIAVGLAGALLAVRVIASFLFGVGASDPLTLGSVALVLLLVAAAASYIPSRRALRVDPIAALRAD